MTTICSRNAKRDKCVEVFRNVFCTMRNNFFPYRVSWRFARKSGFYAKRQRNIVFTQCVDNARKKFASRPPYLYFRYERPSVGIGSGRMKEGSRRGKGVGKAEKASAARRDAICKFSFVRVYVGMCCNSCRISGPGSLNLFRLRDSIVRHC